MPDNRDTPMLDALNAFELNDMRPFCGGRVDIADACLREAHAIAIMLGTALRDSEDTRMTNGAIMESALSGISTLVALAVFAGVAK